MKKHLIFLVLFFFFTPSCSRSPDRVYETHVDKGVILSFDSKSITFENKAVISKIANIEEFSEQLERLKNLEQPVAIVTEDIYRNDEKEKMIKKIVP